MISNMDGRILNNIEKEVFLFLNKHKQYLTEVNENGECSIFYTFNCTSCGDNKICECFNDIKRHTNGVCSSCNRLNYYGDSERLKTLFAYEIDNDIFESNDTGICSFCKEYGSECLCINYITDIFCDECERFLLANDAEETLLSAFAYTLNRELVQSNIIFIEPKDVPEEVAEIEEDDGNSTNKCVVCLTNKINTVLLNCRHAMFCHTCINKIDNYKCPYCREKFTKRDIFKIYIP